MTTHNAVRAEFSRLAMAHSASAKTLVAFLGRAYKYKSDCDYAIGEKTAFTRADAETAIAAAKDFVAQMSDWLGE